MPTNDDVPARGGSGPDLLSDPIPENETSSYEEGPLASNLSLDMPTKKGRWVTFAIHYGIAILSIAITLTISIILKRYSLSINLTILIIAALAIPTWIGGRGPGLFIAVVFELVTLLTRPPEADASIGNYIFGHVTVMTFYVLLVLLVSSRRKAEKDISEQREWLTGTLSSINEGVIATDTDGLITFVNPNAEALTGWTSADAVGKPLDEVFNIPQRRRQDGSDSLFPADVAEQATLIDKAGNEIVITESRTPIKTRDGRVFGMVSIFHDISDSLRADAARRELEERYKTLFDYAPDGIVISDPDSHYLDANTSISRMLGYEREEIIGLHAVDIVADSEIEHIPEALSTIKNESEYHREWQFRRKDGSQFAAEVIATQMPDGNLLAMIRDVTDRRRAELERKVIFEIIQGVVTTRNLDEFFNLVHRSISQIVYADNCFVMLHDPLTDMVHFEFWVDSRDAAPPPKTRGTGFASYVLRTGDPLLLDKESKEKLEMLGDAEQIGSVSASWLGVPLRTPHRTLGVLVLQHYDDESVFSERDLEFLASVGDQIALAIERKRAEAENARLAGQIDAERGRLNKIVASVPGVVWEAWSEPDEAAQRIDFVSDHVHQMMGYTTDEWLSVPNFWLMIVHDDDRERVRREAAAGFTKGFTRPLEFRWKTKDGRSIWVEVHSAIITDDNGKQVGVRGVTIDVTERKRAEEALRESDDRYHTLFDANPHPMWVYDLETMDFLAVNNAAIRHYGYSRDEFLAMTIRDIRPEEDIPALMASVGVKRDGVDNAGVWRHQKKDGTIIEVEITTHELDFAGRRAEVVLANDVTERQKASAALRDAEEKYRSIFENAIEGIFQSTPGGRFISVNPAMAEILGYDSPAELVAGCMDIATEHYVDPDTRAELDSIVGEHDVVLGYECEVFRRDGKKIWTKENMRAVRGPDGELLRYEGSIEDITGRKQLEEQFSQSQKMEAVGVLAGGIAHDFNNLLTAISGYSDLTLQHMSSDDALRHFVEEIKNAGSRAAALTGQLLAFGRKQVLKPRVHNLNTVITEIEGMLRRIIRENIEFRTVLDPQLSNIKADPGQMEQVIMNLVINARDAMPGGGTLTIETRNEYLDADYASGHLTVMPGPYVKLTVTDNGTGIDEETRLRIFEPFFTTKDVGKGTGLGLSTVHGIVKQSGGEILVYSEAGHGSTFKIYIPCVEESVERPKWIEGSKADNSGTETILLVEDEEIVRNLVREILKKYGYTVIEAVSGDAALAICNEYADPIHMLLTDVIMPKMGGPALKEKVLGLRPLIKVLFMSGYTDDSIIHSGILGSETPFIEKPFSPDSLARKVREVLEG